MSASSSLIRGVPVAELAAMRLDGEVYVLGTGWVPVDIPDSPTLRSAAVMAGRPRRLVAGGITAAWIWGAVPVLSQPLTLLADVRARARLRPGSQAIVREMTLAENDVIEFDGARVTTPLRTLLDLACDGAHADLIRALASVAGMGTERVLAVARQERRPGVQAARRTIAAALS